MNKKIIFLGIILFLCVPKVFASSLTGYIIDSDVLIASKANLEKPNNSCLYKENGRYSSIYTAPGQLHCLDSGDEVKIINSDDLIPSTVSSCSKGFYKVSFNTSGGATYEGYVCSDKINTNVDTNSYKEEFKNSGIPEIYYDKLTLLKQKHPNWKFTGYKTNLNFSDVVNNESIVGMSYIQSSNPIYLSLESGSYDANKNAYIMKEAGGWYAANKETVAYYLDPRNFFDEKSIFMFENLGYNSKYQTKEVVDKILSNTDLLQYSDKFIQAANYDNNSVSPLMLAARSRQEVVLGDGHLSDSANGKGGYYNFYNLGALSSCDNPITCAMNFASGFNGKYTNYNRPWTTPELSILNGASYIASGYINQKQNTLYFQKFNVTNNSYGNYSHQYMTNVMAPLIEAKGTQASYSAISGLLESEIEFIIPVYNNMPSNSSALPTKVNQKAVEEKKEEVKNINTGDMIQNAGYKIKGEYLTNITINTTAKDMLSKFNAATILRDNVSIKDSEKLGTADILKIDNSSFKIIVYGDANGDGEVNAVDYVKIRNYIMGSSGLNGSFKEASDVNQDGSVNAMDYVNVRNYIMGNSSTLK